MKIGGLGLPQIVRLTKFVIFLPFSGSFFGMVRFAACVRMKSSVFINKHRPSEQEVLDGLVCHAYDYAALIVPTPC